MKMTDAIIRKLNRELEPGSTADLHAIWTMLNQAARKVHQSEERDAIIADLLEKRILKQSGNGSSIRFTRGSALDDDSEQDSSKKSKPQGFSAPEDIPERALMNFLKDWIAKDHAYRLFPASSRQGRAKVIDTSAGGGKVGLWSRPDFTLAALQTGKFSNIRQIELAGYELKRAGAADLTSVHEALAHRRWVNRAYLVIYAPPGFDDDGMVADLKTECGRYGLGFVTFSRLQDNSSFIEHLPASRASIPPQLTEEFIESRMADVSDELRKWIEEKE